MNPVLFHDVENDAEFTPFVKELSEFSWKNQIVGVSAAGLYYVDDRVARTGHYEFTAKRLPWKNAANVTIASCLSYKGILFGVLCLVVGVMVFIAGWIKSTHTGPGIFAIPVLGIAGGAIFILGARRNSIQVSSPGGTLNWRSAPMTYQKTLEYCQQVKRYCQQNNVHCESHV